MSAHIPAPSSDPRLTDGWRSILNLTVVVAALGYFVDIYDIVLFTMVRIQSCRDLGIGAPYDVGLLDWQMWGMLAGGLCWGVLGDRRGRTVVLFGSILVYSLANLANAAVGLVPGDAHAWYAGLRFLAGFGLAGELGAAITLVSEITSARSRGYATAVVAAIGIAGAVAAFLVAESLPWRWAYAVGGLLGLLLLGLRMRVAESGMFDRMRTDGARTGSLALLFGNCRRLFRFACSVAVGLPIWCVVGMVAMRPDKLAEAMGGEPGLVKPSTGTLICYLGLIIGDLLSGCLSQLLRRRRVVVGMSVLAAAVLTSLLLTCTEPSPQVMYGACGALGVACGYWAVFVTISAEQFGTNVRSTVAGLVPNLVRGGVPLWSLAIAALVQGGAPLPMATLGVVLATCAVALIGLMFLPETWGTDLDHLEQ